MQKCLACVCWTVPCIGRLERGRRRRTEVVPHTGCEASGTGYRVRSIAACLVRKSGTLVPPLPQEPLRASFPIGHQRQHAVQYSVDLRQPRLRLQLLSRLRLRLRACPTPATVPSTATSIGISINRSSRGPEYLTVQPHGIDTATSTAWIQIPQANHARHRRQDRQRGKCYAAAMCFQCYGPLSCLLLVMSSQEVPLVSSHLISSRQF